MKTTLAVKTTDTAGKAQQKAVTYINPAATNAALKTFAQKLAGLTTDNYVDAERINTMSVNEADSTPAAASKTQPTLSLGVWTKSGTTYSATITYNGDGTLSSTLGTISGTTLSITDADGIFSGVISASEGTTYAAGKLAFSYNTEEVQTGKTEGLFTYDGGDLTYNGDGQVYVYDRAGGLAEVVNDISEFRNPEEDQYFFASETNNFTAAFILIEKGE